MVSSVGNPCQISVEAILAIPNFGTSPEHIAYRDFAVPSSIFINIPPERHHKFDQK